MPAKAPRVMAEKPSVKRFVPAALGVSAAVAGGLLLRALAARGHGPEPGNPPIPAPPASSIAPAPPASASIFAALPKDLPEQAMPPHFAEAVDVSTFQKGNIHTHTRWSDGDSLPADVYGWYRDHGYNFLAVTDHNTRTDPLQFKALEKKKAFVLIPGEEVTMTGAGKQVHVNALCTTSTIGGHHFDRQRDALAWAVEKILAQGGVALVNHPNFDWALTAPDLAGAHGAALLEIASGHPWVHTDGDETHLSHEAIWDTVLTGGETFAGVAVDDSHHFRPSTQKHQAKPGRAWIEVFAAEPSRKLICEALGAGRLYASTGVKLQRIAVLDDTYAVTVAGGEAQVEFIGAGGAVLQKGKTGEGGAASYTLRGGEVYVRARITAPDGKRAWTQPSRLATVPRKATAPALLALPDAGASPAPTFAPLSPNP
jgi:hypothetical protein